MPVFRRLLFLVVGISLVLAACDFIPAYSTSPGFQAASLVPSNAWYFSTLTLRPSLGQLAQANSLANVFTSQPGWDAAVRSLQSDAGSSPRLDLAKDVLPLIDGEIALAAYSTNGSSYFSPTTLLLIHSSDPVKLLNVMNAASTPPLQASTASRGATIMANRGAAVAAYKN